MKRQVLFYASALIITIMGGCVTKVQKMQPLPCSVCAEKDTIYIRRIGHGVDSNLQMARMKALFDAKMRIMSHIVSLEDTAYAFQTWIVDKLPFEKECEKVYSKNNEYYVYIRLAVTIPDENRLIYYREIIRKNADEKQKQILEKQKVNNVMDTIKYETPFVPALDESDSVIIRKNNNQ